MRLRNTLLLAVLFILLGAYVYFFELQKGGKKSEKLFPFKEDEVASIVLTYPEREIHLQQETSGKWKLTQPIQAAADESTISGILSALSASDIKRTIEKKPSPEDLKSFGLDRPAVKVSITLKNGITLPPLLMGAKTPLGNAAYVRRGSEPGVYLADASLSSVLERRLNDFRGKQILSFPRDQVAKIQIRTPTESLVLVKGEKEEWKIAAPKKVDAKAGAVADYLAELGRLRANEFVDDRPRDLRKYGLDAPALKISLEEKEGKNLGTLLIGSGGSESYFAKREGDPAIYAIDDSSYKLLHKQLSDFIAEERQEPKK